MSRNTSSPSRSSKTTNSRQDRSGARSHVGQPLHLSNNAVPAQSQPSASLKRLSTASSLTHDSSDLFRSQKRARTNAGASVPSSETLPILHVPNGPKEPSSPLKNQNNSRSHVLPPAKPLLATNSNATTTSTTSRKVAHLETATLTSSSTASTNQNATKKTSTTATRAATTNTKSKNSSKSNASTPRAEKPKTILTAWLAKGPKGSAGQPIVIPSSSPPPPDIDPASTQVNERASQSQAPARPSGSAAGPKSNPTLPAAQSKSSQPLTSPSPPPRKTVDPPRGPTKSSTSKTTPPTPRRSSAPSHPLPNVTGGQKSVASSRQAPTPVQPSPKRARISAPTTAAPIKYSPPIPPSQSSSRPRPSSDTTRGAKVAHPSTSTSRSAPSQPSKPPPTSQPRPQPPLALPLPTNDHVTHARSSGLHNTLNDCYSLAALQTVFLKYQPVYHVHDGPCDLRRVSCALKDIIQAMGDNPDAVIDPATFKAACEREGWRFGGQDNVAAFLEWLTRRLNGELGPSISVVSDAMCANCKCPYVRQAYAACIAIEPSNGSSTQELLNHWDQQEIKAPTLYGQDRCDHGADVTPSRVVEIGDHLAVFIPRAEKDRVTNVKSINIDKMVRLRIPPHNDSPELVWTGYPISVISFHGVDNAGHYTATVLEDGGWSFKNDALSSRLPDSPDPRLPHSPIHHHSISSTATLVVFRKFADVNPLAFLPGDYAFTTLDSDEDEDEGNFDPNLDFDFKPLLDGSENDGPDTPSTAPSPAHDATVEYSSKPENIKRREDRAITGPLATARKREEAFAYLLLLAKCDHKIEKHFQKYLRETEHLPIDERLQVRLEWICVHRQRAIEPLLDPLTTAVEHDPTCEAVDAWVRDPTMWNALNHPNALRRVTGDRATLLDQHKFYHRSWECKVREAIQKFKQYARDHPADISFAYNWLKRLEKLDPEAIVRIHYIGETTSSTPQLRQDQDHASALSGKLPSRTGHMLGLLADTKCEVYEWTEFTRFIGDASAGTLTQRRRHSLIAERFLILCGGCFVLNSSDGGLPSSKFDLDAMSPQALAAEAEMQTRFPFRPPPRTDARSDPQLAQVRAQLKAIQEIEFDANFEAGGFDPPDHAKAAIMASVTGVGMNEYGRVVQFGIFKDRTGEELKGESTITGPYAGPGPTMGREHSARARQLSLRWDVETSVERLTEEFACNGWAFTDMFPLRGPHKKFHLEVLGVVLKLCVAKPIVILLLGSLVTNLSERELWRLPRTPERLRLFSESGLTKTNYQSAGNSLPKTSWYERLIAEYDLDHFESPDFLEKAGNMMIVEYLEEEFSVGIVRPHWGGSKHDPGILNEVEELGYLIELKCLKLNHAASKLSNPTVDDLVALMDEVDRDCAAVNTEIRWVKDKIRKYHTSVGTLRSLTATGQQDNQARSERMVETMQKLIKNGVTAPHSPHSEERQSWVDDQMAKQERARKFRLPTPIPELLANPSDLPGWLMALAEGKLVVQSVNGKNGHVALDKRKDTPEGRKAIKRQSAKTGEAHMRRLRPDGALSFNEDNWRNTQSAPQAVKKLVDANFDKNQPRDSVPEISRCQCGDTPIITGASVHRCPLSSDPTKFVPVAELAREGHLQSVRVLTPYEVLSSPLGHSLPDGFLERERLVQLPSAACLPSSIVIPPMTPECEAAWNDSYVIVHNDPNRSPESGILQAILNLASCIHRPLRQVDLIFRDICDPGIYRKLSPILLGLQPDAQIWEVNCKRCPQKKIATSRQGKGQRVYTPQKHQHQRRLFFPDGYPRLVGDAAAVEALSDGLRTHGDARHEGKVGQEYRSFWELPLMVKKAYIHACFFSDAVLAKEFEEGGKVRSLVGQVVRVVNWCRNPRG
ncbi:hypothetical protein DL93DRAFT_2086090 [Clavulina sp. PMI_390]|nr:hypothetical protein DL93DRAFT_2086090 [Clavulina sp. PMI_390]